MIARKSALIMVTNVINGILGYIALFLVSRFMAVPDFALGVVGFAYGFGAMFVIFSNLGFDQAHIKRISEKKDYAKCLGTFFSIKIILTGVMAFLLVVSVLIWKHIFGMGFETPTHELAVYVMLIYFVLWSLTQIFISTFRAQKQIAKAEIPFLAETIGRVVATAVVVINGMGVIALVSTYIVGELAILATAIFFFRGNPIKKPTWEYAKLYVKFALPLAVVVASTKIMTNVDKVLIQLFWNAVEVGNYWAIFKLSRFLDMATVAIGILLFPTMSALYAKKDMSGIKKLSFMSERYLSMIIFPILFFMIFLAKPVIHILLSNKFYAAIPILQILPAFALFDALDRPYQMKLLGMNHPKLARNRIVLMMVVNIILNLVLIPTDIKSLGITLFGLGAVGAAIATVISYVVGLAYTRIKVWRISQIKINYRIFMHLFAAFIMGIFLFYFNDFYPIGRWYELLGFAFFGLSIYLGILYLLGEFTKDDFDLFIDTLNIKKMFAYIKGELKGK